MFLKLCVLLAALAALVTSSLAQDKPCTTSADCGSNECCLSTAMRKGKRQASAYCRPRGDVKNTCYVNNDQFLSQHASTMYYDACPCKSDFACRGTGMISVPQGEQGICSFMWRGKRSTCSSSKDCDIDECCVSRMQPIGKRGLGFGLGDCRKLGQAGDSCYVRYNTLNDMNLACPCASGLTCKGSGLFVVPTGETGTCTS